MAVDAKQRKRLSQSLGVAERWMESAEAGAKAGNPSLVVEASHLTVHNAAVAYQNLKRGRSGRLRHEEVGKRAAEMGMPEGLASAVALVERLHIPTSYGAAAPSWDDAERAIGYAREVLAFVRKEAKKAGLL